MSIPNGAFYYEGGILKHHGVKGQHWGIRNGPPYPLGRGKESVSYKVTRNGVVSIFDSLSDSEKIHLAGQAGNPTVPKTLHDF